MPRLSGRHLRSSASIEMGEHVVIGLARITARISRIQTGHIGEKDQIIGSDRCCHKAERVSLSPNAVPRTTPVVFIDDRQNTPFEQLMERQRGRDARRPARSARVSNTQATGHECWARARTDSSDALADCRGLKTRQATGDAPCPTVDSPT